MTRERTAAALADHTPGVCSECGKWTCDHIEDRIDTLRAAVRRERRRSARIVKLLRNLMRAQGKIAKREAAEKLSRECWPGLYLSAKPSGGA